MSTIKSFFDKYLPFPDHRKRKISEDKPHDSAPKRKLPRLSQLSVVRRVPEEDLLYHPQYHQQQQQLRPPPPPPALKPLIPKSRGFFSGPAFSFRKSLPSACYSKHSSRYGMDSIELESDDDVELVEFLQSQDMSPATVRKFAGRDNGPRPLPGLIPRNNNNTHKLNGGSSSNSSNYSAQDGPTANAYSLFKKRFNIASPQIRVNQNTSRGQHMVNTALRKSFNQQEKQKYSDMCSGMGPLFGGGQARVVQQQRPAEGSLFGAIQRSSVLNGLPFTAKDNINIGSRNKYGKLLAKFSSDIDTRRGGATFRANAANQQPSVCVDLTRHSNTNGGTSSSSCNHRRSTGAPTVELTDDEEEDDEEVIDLDGNDGSFKIPKSFPCANSVDNQQTQQHHHLQSPRWSQSSRHKEFLMALDQNEAGAVGNNASIVLDDDEEGENGEEDLQDDDQVTTLSSTTSTTGRQRQLEKVEPVNTLLDEWQTKPVFKDDWLEATRRRYTEKQEQWSARIAEEQQLQAEMERESRQDVQDMIKKMDEALLLREVIVVEDEEQLLLAAAAAEKPKDTPLPTFTAEQMNTIRYAAGRGAPDEVLVTKFNLNITRRDIGTLMGDAWLNDEVINFYMNLLMERSGEGYPKVYAMNTFFMPKVLQQGQSGVRRWTRKADIFSYDVIPVPVHVSNIHWCMAIIHIRDRWIRYYDSMGQPNRRVLDALEQYLKDESMDKRKVEFSMEGWVKESVADCPRQMNGSDCGVFSCMFAEYVSRNHRINFTQDNMPYFRQKMILEICSGKLLL